MQYAYLFSKHVRITSVHQEARFNLNFNCFASCKGIIGGCECTGLLQVYDNILLGCFTSLPVNNRN